MSSFLEYMLLWSKFNNNYFYYDNIYFIYVINYYKILNSIQNNGNNLIPYVEEIKEKRIIRDYPIIISYDYNKKTFEMLSINLEYLSTNSNYIFIPIKCRILKYNLVDKEDIILLFVDKNNNSAHIININNNPFILFDSIDNNQTYILLLHLIEKLCGGNNLSLPKLTYHQFMIDISFTLDTLTKKSVALFTYSDILNNYIDNKIKDQPIILSEFDDYFNRYEIDKFNDKLISNNNKLLQSKL